MDTNKSIASDIVKSMAKQTGVPKSEESEGEDGDAQESGSDLDVAAEEVMEALKDGDAKGFSESLKAFVKLCGMSSDE